MAGYRYAIDVSTVPRNKRRALTRRIKKQIELHPELRHGPEDKLSNSAFAELYEDLDLIVAGARIEYASYHEIGVRHKWRLHNGGIHPGLKNRRFIRRAIRRCTDAPIVDERKL